MTTLAPRGAVEKLIFIVFLQADVIFSVSNINLSRACSKDKFSESGAYDILDT